MEELFQILGIFCIGCTIFVPIVNNVYKDNMWRYIKERIEIEKGNEILKAEFKSKEKKKRR